MTVLALRVQLWCRQLLGIRDMRCATLKRRIAEQRRQRP